MSILEIVFVVILDWRFCNHDLILYFSLFIAFWYFFGGVSSILQLMWWSGRWVKLKRWGGASFNLWFSRLGGIRPLQAKMILVAFYGSSLLSLLPYFDGHTILQVKKIKDKKERQNRTQWFLIIDTI